MLAAIGAVLQIIWLILKNKFEQDAKEKKRIEALHDKASKAIMSRDTSAIISVLDKLRK